MNSPRSLEACRQLGIIPNELYFQDFETYVKMNPEVIALPKEIQKIRFENIDNYRKETIQMVIDQREKIISLSQEKIFQTSLNLKKTQNNTCGRFTDAPVSPHCGGSGFQYGCCRPPPRRRGSI